MPPTHRPTPGASSPGTEVFRPNPAERGTTTLADKVVEKIAARASLEVAHAQGISRRIAGRAFGTPTVRADARIDGQVASLDLELVVDYPASARGTTRAVRTHVTERVGALCDLRIDHIDITVTAVRRPDQDRRRVQ